MPDLGEQAISKVAEVGISSQLDEVEEINVDIRTDPLKMMQGQVDSVAIDGKGMVMQEDLRMEEMQITTGSISINPLSAAFGKIELQRPTEADVHVVLTAEDMNRAFNSDFIREKLQNLPVTIDGQQTTVNAEQVGFCMPSAGKFAISANVKVASSGESKQVAFTATPKVADGGQRIALEDVEYSEGEGLSPELTTALLEQATSLLDLRNFALEGMSLRLKQLNVQEGRLTLEANALVEQFPSGES
ncbi:MULTISPECIES: DUF2993 domain-containing protein [Trichocoleus]|uniref:DUF2993 domain-containing protein n=1 Tax=Trichocoleus desertorum GB2-A4 TaxID=2933944 RepID=A0ABV0J9B2_9CYAN|nr:MULTISPECIES: DUF2993 domain-containing protein [unclassified Trichocoleus]MBD1864743.1 DUF2993 domain-containing protein [Trichocoleus sp. FACHB-46]MBD2097311.1 DUF2993 domain-containing protein [Trichocoleus sp. FACHB-591]MBD2120360.1 DUF2993 domain-containing protein [Trichocoleus sp. FACHB-262]